MHRKLAHSSLFKAGLVGNHGQKEPAGPWFHALGQQEHQALYTKGGIADDQPTRHQDHSKQVTTFHRTFKESRFINS